jgi:acyl carrier protein
MSLRSVVLTQFAEVAQEQGRPLVPLVDDLPLADSGLDSLCFAIVVARLEDLLDVDPFSVENISFPMTVREFVKFYENASK